MKRIPLTQGKFALVDDADYERLNQWKWYAVRGCKTFYAARQIRINKGRGGQRLIFMHRIILGLSKNDTQQTDHINGNGLDNRAVNLRKCSPLQNCRNRTGRHNTKSKYKGVVFCRNRWRARITDTGKQIHLGYFGAEKDAAMAYDHKAKLIHGDFAYTNF